MLLRETESLFLSNRDTEIKENANMTRTVSHFWLYALSKTYKNPRDLIEYFPGTIVREYTEGNIYIHKLPLSLVMPYCCGWSIKKVLQNGLKTPNISSNPAKHYDTAISHIVNFFFMTANEWTGAQAMTAVDLYLAPYIYYDKLTNKEIRQGIQRLVYELNYTTRIGSQAPYTNITICLDLIENYLLETAIHNGKITGYLDEYLDYAEEFVKELFKLFREGDAQNRPFTFPIITIPITDRFDWNETKYPEIINTIFQTVALRGSAYFLNGYATDVKGLYAMCCRLTIDINKINNHFYIINRKEINEIVEEIYEYLRKQRNGRGIWAIPDATGSIGVVTINLPRLASQSQDEDELIDKIREKTKYCREVLSIWREKYTKLIRNGYLPLTYIYNPTLANHYSTIGIIGLPEMAMIMTQKTIESWEMKNDAKEMIALEKKIVREIVKITEEYENNDGILYNVEEIPGESASYKLAQKDYRDIQKIRAFFDKNGLEIIYSNSIVPYYANISLYRRIELESEVQPEFTGGVMLHLFLGEAPDPKSLKKLIESIVKNTKIIYFSVTPTITYCIKCNKTITGAYTMCPECKNEKVEIWSRIVGYYRPLKYWSSPRQKEYMMRIKYTLKD